MAAVVKSCLLQIDAKDLLNMAKRPGDGGGSTAYREDRDMLMDLCKQFYYIKSLWRFDEGLVEIPKLMEPWLKQQDAILAMRREKSTLFDISGNGFPSARDLQSIAETKSAVSSVFPLNIKARARKISVRNNITGRPRAFSKSKINFGIN